MTDGFKVRVEIASGIGSEDLVFCGVILRYQAGGQRSFVKEEMQIGCVMVENAKDKVRGRQIIRCGDP